MSELLNMGFQKLFAKQSMLEPSQLKVSKSAMKEFEVREQEITQMLGKLEERKVIKLNGVSRHILKECKQQLRVPICNMIKCLLDTRKVPKEWRRDAIIPIQKSGNRKKPLNQRQKPLTYTICKLCESHQKTRQMGYVERNKISTDRQFGFREEKFCVTNLLPFYQKVTDITQERDSWTDCISLGLKRAFDDIQHK